MLAPRNKLWPSNPKIVELALDLLGLREGDHLADFGCGDGPALFAGCARGAAGASGWEIHEERAKKLKEEVAARGLEGVIRVHTCNALEASLPEDPPITHVYLFLIARGLRLMLPLLRKAAGLLPSQTLPVVTVLYSMEGMTPVETRKCPETKTPYYLYMIKPE